MDKLVSVIITTHERSCNILERAVSSVYNQTYKNIEIIVVNDSKDYKENVNIIEMLAKYKAKYIEHNKKGANSSRNLGIKASKGDIIALLDDDDEWVETKLEDMVPYLNKNISMVYCDFDYIDANGKKTILKKKKYEGLVYNELLYDNFIGGCSIPIINKEILLKVGMFDETMPSCQDIDVWLRIAKNFKIKHVKKKLVHYYISNVAITSNPKKRIDGWEKLIKKYDEDMKVLPNCIIKWKGLIIENKIAFGLFNFQAEEYYSIGTLLKYYRYILRGIIKYILIKFKIRIR